MNTDQPSPIIKMLLLAICLSVTLGGCLASDDDRSRDHAAQRSGHPKVVSTSTIIADWTQAIAGAEIDHSSILKPGVDPHIYEPVPNDTKVLEAADLILYNGYNLEPNLIRLINAVGTRSRRFAVGEVVPPLDFDKDGQKQPDPHVWGSAKNAKLMVIAIRDQLIDLSPEDATLFTRNADHLLSELDAVDRWIAQEIQTIPANHRHLVTTHDAFQYYAHAYGLTVIGTLIGISTEEQPSAQTVQRLANAIQAAGVPAIFAETTINPALITTVADEAKVTLAQPPLYSDSLGVPGSTAETYIKMLVANTKTIVQALGGTYTPFPGSNP